MVTTRNAKRPSSPTVSNDAENVDPQTKKSIRSSSRFSQRSVVQKEELVKQRKRRARAPLREKVVMVEQRDNVEEAHSKDDKETGGKKAESFPEKPLEEVVSLLEPQSLPIWDPMDNWFDETKTSNVKKTFSRKHKFLR